MDHQKRNKVLGIVTLIFAGIVILSSAVAASSVSYKNYSAEFELSPSGYIEYDFGETGLIDFTVTIMLLEADTFTDGITAYIVHDDTSSADGPYARGYHSYTYSTINSLGWDDTTYNSYQSIYFTMASVSLYYMSYIDDNYRIVVVPAVAHTFNAQNVVVSISITTTARGPAASAMIGYVIMLAIPAIILALSAIASAAKGIHPQPRPQYVYPPVGQPMYARPSPTPSAPIASPAPIKKYCPHCASEIDASQKYCGTCGATL